LTDLEHPCQILADFLTIKEYFGKTKGITLTYLGDGNNVAHSLILGGALMGMKIQIATPEDYKPNPMIVEMANKIAVEGYDLLLTSDAVEAAKGSQVLYTDVWASMGQEDLASARIPIFQSYQINQSLLSHADSDAIVLHCLPAHRGEEITDQVMEGKQSKLWDQAENRMHAQKALLAAVLGLI
jgi:ornithine carbamoyltransferase